MNPPATGVQDQTGAGVRDGIEVLPSRGTGRGGSSGAAAVAGSVIDTTDPHSPAVTGSAPDIDPTRVPAPVRRALVAGVWVLVTMASLLVVLFALEPMFQYRRQDELFTAYQTRLDQAANEATGLPGVEVATVADPVGAPVAIIEVGAIGLQQVVLEGATADNLQAAPAHVRGTAGLGQQGAAAVVGRQATFGAPFGDVDQVHAGDPVLVTTTQGESLYEVRSVERRPIGDEVFDPAGRDRLVLVTSAAATPWNTADATVVTADLVSAPFVATPQGGRLEGGTGRSGEVTPLGLGLVAFFGLALVAALVLAVRVQRTRGSRAAYLLATAPVLGLTILAAEHASGLLPGWW